MNKINLTVIGTGEQIAAASRAIVHAMEALKAEGHEFQLEEYMIENDQSWVTMRGKES